MIILKTKKTRDRYAVRARVIKAMSHPTRLFIVDELAKRERCVCELTEMIGDDISTVSKHLSVLKSAGIVVDDKRGQQIYYSLQCPCVMDFLTCVETVLRTHSRLRKDWLA
jgi:ArsR family transcriptional regulator